MNGNEWQIVIIVGMVVFAGAVILLLPSDIPTLPGFGEKSLPIKTVPDPAKNPCFDTGTGVNVSLPTKEWYNQICPNLTRLSKTNTNKALFTKKCACYEYTNR